MDFDRFCGTYVAMWQIAWQLENESATYFFPRFRAILGIVSMWQLFLIYLTREEKRDYPFSCISYVYIKVQIYLPH